MKNTFLMLVIASSFTMCSCSCQRDPQYQQPVQYDPQPTTTVVQPQPVYGGGTTVIHDHDDHGSGMATGLMLGTLLSQSNSNNGGGYFQPASRKKVTKNITNVYNVQTTPRYTQRTQARVVTTTRSAPYQPSRIRTSTSMSSRSMGRRGR